MTIHIWIITNTEGAIISAHHTGCKAGLAESCLHVASTMMLHQMLGTYQREDGMDTSEMLVPLNVHE